MNRLNLLLSTRNDDTAQEIETIMKQNLKIQQLEQKCFESAQQVTKLQKQLTDLKFTCDQKDKNISVLNETLEDNQKQLIQLHDQQVLKQRIQDQHNQLQSLIKISEEFPKIQKLNQDQQRQLKQQVEQHKATVTNVCDQNEELREKVASQQKQIISLQAQLQQTRRETSENFINFTEAVSHKLKKFSAYNTQLESDISQAKQHFEQNISDLQDHAQVLSEQLTAEHLHVIKTQNFITDLDNEIKSKNHLQQSIIDLESQHQILKTKYNNLTNQLSAATLDLDSTQALIDAANAYKFNMNQEKADIQENLQLLTIQLQQTTLDNNHTETELVKNNNKLRALQTQIQTAQLQAEDVQNQVQYLQDIKEQIISAQNELQKLEEKTIEINEPIVEKDEKIINTSFSFTQKQLSQAEIEIADKLNILRKLQHITPNIDTSLTELEILQQIQQEIKTTQEITLKEETEYGATLKKQNEEIEHELQTALNHTKQIEIQKHQAMTLQSELEAQLKANSQLQAQLQQPSTQNTQQAQNQEKTIQQLIEQIKGLEKDNIQLKQQVDEYNLAEHALTDTHPKLDAKLQNPLQDDLIDSQTLNKKAKLEAQIKSLELTYSDLSQKIDGIQKKMSVSAAELIKKQAVLNSLELDIKQARINYSTIVEQQLIAEKDIKAKTIIIDTDHSAEKTKLNLELEQKQAEITQLRIEISSLKEKQLTLEQQILDLQQQLTNIKQTPEKQQQAKTCETTTETLKIVEPQPENTEQLLKLQKENEQFIHQIQKLSQKLKEVKEQQNAAKTESKQNQQSENEELSREKIQLQKEIENLNKQLQKTAIANSEETRKLNEQLEDKKVEAKVQSQQLDKKLFDKQQIIIKQIQALESNNKNIVAEIEKLKQTCQNIAICKNINVKIITVKDALYVLEQVLQTMPKKNITDNSAGAEEFINSHQTITIDQNQYQMPQAKEIHTELKHILDEAHKSNVQYPIISVAQQCASVFQSKDFAAMLQIPHQDSNAFKAALRCFLLSSWSEMLQKQIFTYVSSKVHSSNLLELKQIPTQLIQINEFTTDQKVISLIFMLIIDGYDFVNQDVEKEYIPKLVNKYTNEEINAVLKKE
ncbi:Hypothetical_protein [Hexamita inflata]|uniref:Hypothetical_protein n=1 Tax=Hexamita inflata TaxID=28002 RepID=A0AA86P2E5_9EUKA|nr:Hypothetical protein HINF_LOCUS17408 [Hexamita inflata]